MIIYTDLIRVEHNRPQVILVSILISTILFSVIRAYGGKKRNLTSFILYSFLSVLMLINSTYFAQYNSLTSVFVIKQIPQLKSVGDNLKLLLDITKVALIADLPFLFMYYRVKNKSAGISTYNSRHITNVKLIIFSILILSLIIPYYSYTGQLKSIAAQELFLYHSLDISKSIFKNIDVAAEQVTIEDRIKLIWERRNLLIGTYTGI